MNLSTWKTTITEEGLQDRNGSLNDPTPLFNMEVSEYLQCSGWVQSNDLGSAVQVWRFGIAPVELQIKRDERGLIEAIRLSDETGEVDAPAVFITELDLGFSMRELQEPFNEEAIEAFLAYPPYREMTGQDGKAESLV